MKAKQSLVSRIRGWFPETPKGHKLSFTHSFDAQSLRAPNNYGYSLRQVSVQIDVAMIFATILGSFGLLLVFPRLSFAYWIIMVVLGMFVGLFLAIVPTNYDLKRLIQGDKTKAKFSQIVYIFSLTIIVLAICYFGWAAIVNFDLNIQNFSLLTTFSFAGILVMFVTRTILFAAWERKNNFEIWLGNGFNLFIIPKPNAKSGLSKQENIRS